MFGSKKWDETVPARCSKCGGVDLIEAWQVPDRDKDDNPIIFHKLKAECIRVLQLRVELLERALYAPGAGA